MKLKSIFFLAILITFFSCGEDDTFDSDNPILENQSPSMNGGLVTNIEGYNLVVSWNAATDSQGDNLNYKIGYLYKVAEDQDYQILESLTVNETSHTKTDITLNRWYKIEVYAVDSEGNESEKLILEDISFFNSPPSAVTDVIIDKSQSSADVSWTASVDEDNDIITYKIESYQLASSPLIEPTLIETYTTTDTSITLNNLEQFIIYSVIITAIDPLEFESEAVQTNFALLPEGTYTGDIILNSQTIVDVFLNHNIQTVEGDVIISYPLVYDEQIHDSIDDLNPLAGFEVINGNLIIKTHGKHHFNDLSAFNQVTTVTGTLQISDFQAEYNSIGNYSFIKDFNQFSSLESVGTLELIHNKTGFSGGFNLLYNISNDLIIKNNGWEFFDAQEDYFAGFPALLSVNGNIEISSNRSFESITDLGNLTEVGGDFIISPFLFNTSLPPMNSLTSIGGDYRLLGTLLTSMPQMNQITIISGNFEISNSLEILDFNGLNNLTQIGGDIIINDNQSLSSVSSLNNLTQIGGNIIINNNQSLTSISSLNNLTQINGDFIISSNNNLMNITGLSSLNQITGSFVIENNNQLTSLNNLNALNLIQDSFIIDSNSSLNTLPILSNLSSIGNLLKIRGSNFSNLDFIGNTTSITEFQLIDNTNLSNINTSNLTYLETLYVKDNPALTQLDFSNVNVPISTLVEIEIINNDGLTGLIGLNGFSHFKSLEIKNNPQLNVLTALNNVNIIDNCLQIYNNDDLTNLDFLSNLTTISCGQRCRENTGNQLTYTNNLVIRGNYNLSDYCGLTNFFMNNGLCYEEYSILENGYNPTHLDIIDGNCTN